MKQLICCTLIIALILTLVPVTHSISPKTGGKLVLVAILSGVTIFTRYLVKQDIRTTRKLHNSLGAPDRIVEYKRGFDCWRVEWYGNQQYFFRNGVLNKTTKLHLKNRK